MEMYYKGFTVLTDPTTDSNFKSVKQETLMSPARESIITPAGPKMSNILVTDSILWKDFGELVIWRKVRLDLL